MVGVDCVDASTHRHNQSKQDNHDESHVYNDGILLDRHVVSPKQSFLIVPGQTSNRGDTGRNAHKRGTVKKGPINHMNPEDSYSDESMSSDEAGLQQKSKEFFEPDEISMVSCPQEINGPGMQMLAEEIDAIDSSKFRNTTKQFHKPKLYKNLGQKNQRRRSNPRNYEQEDEI